MRILGIDPGLGITGYGVIETSGDNFRLIESGTIKAPNNLPLQDRLSKIYKNLTELIAEHRPQVMALEDLYSHYKHPTTSILMGHVRGIVCLASAQARIPLFNYPSTRIKKAIIGRGNASKLQIQRMVQFLLKLKEIPRSTDVTDALALAIAHFFISKDITYGAKRHKLSVRTYPAPSSRLV
jgi:crossover junction endodeoxyribonuclease RuvC